MIKSSISNEIFNSVIDFDVFEKKIKYITYIVDKTIKIIFSELSYFIIFLKNWSFFSEKKV